MKPSTGARLVEQVLEHLTRFVIRNRRKLLWAHMAAFVLSVFVTAMWLEFNTSRNDLVGANKRYHQNYLRLLEEFPFQEDLVVVVESEDAEKNRQFVERIGARLQQETNLFRSVFYKGDLRTLGPKALLLVPEPDLQELLRMLQDYKPFIRQFSSTTNLVSLFEMVNTQIRTAKREADAQTKSLMNALPALERIIRQGTASLQRPGSPPSPGVAALFNAGEQANESSYIAFAEGTIYLVTAHAVSSEHNAAAVERMRELIASTQAEVTGVNVGLTGEPVLEIDEMDQSRRDSIKASLCSLLLCALIFVYGYHETGRPIKATVCLVVGLAYTLAFTTLVIGHLNVLTVTFVPILIGLAIDFGVHLVTRYEEELRHGRTKEESLTRAMVKTGRGIFTGAFTTATAFLAMGFTDFRGIQEMGVICGGGLLICLIPMTTLLPVLLLGGRQNILDHQLGDRSDTRARIERLWLRRPKLVILAVVLTTGWAILQFRNVHFDYNLLNMQSENLAAVEYEMKLIDSTPKSVLFAAVMADSAQEADALEKRIVQLPSVESIDSMSQFLVEDPEAKLQLIRQVKQELASIEFRNPDPDPVDVPALSRTLYSLNGYLGSALEEIPPAESALSNQLASLRLAIQEFRKGAWRGDPARQDLYGRRLGAFQQALLEDLRGTFEGIQDQDDSGGLRAADLPPGLRDRFIGRTGKHLLQVYPKKDVWQRENQEEFVGELQTIDPRATGTPVQLYYYTDLLVESYKQAAWYALGAVCILILIHFRSLMALILVLVPMATGFAWLCGLMGYWSIPFNPANIMTLPLLIGIGVTNGIHILNRFAEEQNPSILAKSTGKAVLVSGLTTMAGFGSLMLGNHLGIRSLGQVMAVGVASCMIASLAFLPTLLNLFFKDDPGKKQPSVVDKTSTLGREEPR